MAELAEGPLSVDSLSATLTLLVSTGISDIKTKVQDSLDESPIDNKEYADKKFADITAISCERLRSSY